MSKDKENPWNKESRIIAQASPEYKKYTSRILWLFLLEMVAILLLAFALPIAIVALLAITIAMIATSRKQKKYLEQVEKEIEANGNTAEWWNESNKAYRNYMAAHGKPIAQQQNFAPTNVKASNSGSAAGKAAVDIAASYAMGKAATNAISNTRPVSNMRSNPSTTAERGRQAREAAKANQSMSRIQRSQSKERISSGGKTYYISTMPNGTQTLTDAGGRRIGQFDSVRNVTTDKNGRRVGNGNLLKRLI
ncbi:MAG: hypothetical protein LUH56_02660 [Oscillospiraceae bacterium]|nr:hypothetical protein [Oscillospiraceae bacterium]